MSKRIGWVGLAIVMGIALTGKQSAAVDGDGHAALPGLDQAAAEFWSHWEGAKPSDAIRRAAATPDDQRLWDTLGQRADDFQSRSTGGRCQGHSEIARKAMSDNMQYVSYLALYDPTPLRVHVLFYRSRDTWTIIALRIDGDPTRWLDEAAQSVSPAPPAQQNGQ